MTPDHPSRPSDASERLRLRIVGHDRVGGADADPVIASIRDQGSVRVVDDPRAEQPAVALGGSGRGLLGTGRRHQPVRPSRRAEPATIPLTPTTSERRAATPSRMPAPRGSGRATRPGSTDRARSRPRSTTPPEDAGCGRVTVLRSRSEPPSPRVASAPPDQYSWKCRSSSLPSATTAIRVATGSSLIGRMRGTTPNSIPTAAVARVSVSPASEQVRAEQVRGQVQVPEVEPGLIGVERTELLRRSEGLVPPPPPSFAVEDVAEPVGHRVQVGRHAARIVTSSPVLTIATSSGATTRTSPRRNFPAPIPPASAATRIHGSVVRSRTDGRGHDRARFGARSPAPMPARRCRSARSRHCSRRADRTCNG